MSEPSSTDWSAPWMDAQKKYWEAWLDLSRQNLAGTPMAPEPAANPWSQSFDLWSKLMTSAAPPESRDWVKNMVEMNRAYLQFGETVWKGLTTQPSAPTPGANWWNWVADSFKGTPMASASPFGGGADPMAGFATFWGMPMDNWRRVYSACSIMPGDFEKALRGFAPFVEQQSSENLLGQAFSTPALGYTREWQGEVQKWGQLWMEHVEALRQYGTLLANSTCHAGELLQAKLTQLTETGKTPDTLRGFYDLWVDAGEEAYAATANGLDFAKAQANLSNSLMAVKRQEQKMVDEVLSGLNMPTRRELDTSHRRLHQLQREVWRLQESFEDSGIRELREEVMSLRRELEAQRGEGQPQTPEKPKTDPKPKRPSTRKSGA